MSDPRALHPDEPHALWQRAAAFAARMHAAHVRKDGVTPYFAHPARVAMVVRDVFGCDDPEVIAAAFLHDTLEDTPADYDDIESRFGAGVADLVAALSKNMLLPEREREAEYDARLAAASWRARLVKLADVVDNAGDLETRPDGARGSVIRAHVERMDRAMALAERDAGEHSEIERALRAVRGIRDRLMDRARG